MRHTHARLDSSLGTSDLGPRLVDQISQRYNVDPRLASEMAWDLLELIAAVDGDLETLDKFFLN